MIDDETSQTVKLSAIGILAAVLVGLVFSAILLTPMLFFSTDKALLIGWCVLFMLFLMKGKNHRLEISFLYIPTGLVYFGLAQSKLHSNLWPYILVEKIWLLVGSIMVLIVIATGTIIVILLVYGALFDKRR